MMFRDQPRTTSWRDRAACIHDDSDVWTADKPDPYEAARAKAICVQCPVLDACRESIVGIKPEDVAGIWAGMAPEDRSSRRPVECGSERAYQRHRYRGESCLECRRAHADHQRKVSA